jgi:WD40 repeat protein
MGKSSLMVRVAERLRQEDGAKAVLLELISSPEVTIEQWYNGLLNQIGRKLGLKKEIREFSQEHLHLEPVQRWVEVIRYVVLTLDKQPLIICFDEIDVVRSLSFCADDFFAAIRGCYNARSQDTELQRLTFCLIGAAKPTDLIQKSHITPFDIGQAIELTGFQFKEAQGLAKGLKTRAANPDAALRAVLDWTNGQPFLTQKICHFIQQLDAPIQNGQEAASINQLVQDKIIKYWESQDHPQHLHLQTIRDRLLRRDDGQYTWRLLGLCQQIHSTKQDVTNSDDEMELRLTGLMVKSQGQLRYFNKIYEKVFDQEWIRRQLKEVIGPNPYLGLSAFEAKHAEKFFGRDELIEKLWQTLRDLHATQAPRFLAILGPSGSGKSSVARAGLMVALEKRLLPGLQKIQFDTITPTEQPIKTLAGVLAKRVETDFDEQRREFEKLLRNQEDALISIIASLPHIDSAPLVILIDQFEEIYTLCKAADRRAFIDNMMAAVTDRSGHLSIILTLRSDFLGETQRHEALNQLIFKQKVIVPMMTQAELRLAIGQPAENAGHPLDNAIISLLVKQTKDLEGVLPLLQFALTRLWSGLIDGVDPIYTLEEIDGVGGALAQKAEDIYQKLSEGDKNIARRAFLKLVEPGTKNTRRRVNMKEIVAHHEEVKKIHSLLNQFADKEARLITLSENEQGQITVEITHEALLENWDTLKEWVLTHNEDWHFEHRLTEAVSHWDTENRAEGLLWGSPDFEQLQKFHERASQDMTTAQMDFYRASENKKRWARRKGWGTIALIILTFISIASTYWAFTERGKAQQERNKAQRTQSLFLANLAQQDIDKGNMTNGILLALEALPKDMSDPDRPSVVEAEEKLNKAISQHRERFVLQGYEPMTHAAFSPDGKQLVTTGSKGSLYFWDVSNGKLLLFLYKAHTANISQVAFSPDGKFLVTASDDKTACLWDNNGKRLFVFEHQKKVYSATFSPDGKLVLTRYDNTAHLWKTSSGKFLSMLKHKKGIADAAKIYHATFSPNTKFVVTTSDDGTARLWDSYSGKRLSILKHKHEVYNAVFSSDSKQILTVSYKYKKDGVSLWEVSSSKLITTLDDYYAWLVAFSNDGKQIVTISRYDDVILWDASNGKQLSRYDWEEPLKGYNITSDKIALNPEGKLVFVRRGNKAYLKIPTNKTLSGFGKYRNNDTYLRKVSIRRWKPYGLNYEEFSVLYGHRDDIYHVAFSPDGKLVVTVSKDNTVRLWNATSKVSQAGTLGLGDVYVIQKLIDNANKIVPHCLTSEQRKKFFLTESQSHLLIAEGEKLARKGQIDKAIEKFEQAKMLESCHKFEPRERVREIAAYALIEKGRTLAEQDKIEAAIIEFKKAQEIDFRFNTSYMVEDLSNRRIKTFGKEERIPSPASKRKYDERGNLIHRAYFDETGNPTTHSQYGFHKFTQKFDEQDNFMAFAVFDVAGNPTTHKDGYHKSTKKIEENGRQTEWAYFDVADNPIIPKHVSYHKLVKTFNEHGLDIEWAYFDTAGNLTRKYDADGNLIKKK